MKYLYGASVQGIQKFIFETNKLVEIAGASEIVEQICTNIFEDCIGENTFNEDNLIIGAAGNIKYVFDSKNDCEQLVYFFPKTIMEKAPGITISQAVVELSNPYPQNKDIDKLEKRLRIQRNRATAQHGLGLMISERSRKTGKAGVEWKKEVVDLSQQKKLANKDGSRNNLLSKILGSKDIIPIANYPNDINDILAETLNSNWIAVVHADGNNLGKLILNMAESTPPEQTQKVFREFSGLLEQATTTAAAKAYEDTINYKDKLPIRPVVLGGDDLTVIIRGDLALPFTTSFLKHFEAETKKVFGEDKGLTACAGIAYIKSNYPFHYGVELCEDLCKYSKVIAKDINPDNTPSCLTFHKVQSSFIEDYNDIIKQELTAGTVQFNNGPYFINNQPNYHTIDMLNYWVDNVKQKNAPKAPLRNWLSELQINKDRAKQQLDRIKQINSEKIIDKLNIENPFSIRKKNADEKEQTFTHIFDVLTIATIQPN